MYSILSFCLKDVYWEVNQYIVYSEITTPKR